jgi:hypothetical protein
VAGLLSGFFAGATGAAGLVSVFVSMGLGTEATAGRTVGGFASVFFSSADWAVISPMQISVENPDRKQRFIKM